MQSVTSKKLKTNMIKHSNLYHEIQMRPIKRNAVRWFHWAVLILIAVGIIFLAHWYRVNAELAQDNYYSLVHNCLSTVHRLSMVSAAFHYDASQCLSSPLAVK